MNSDYALLQEAESELRVEDFGAYAPIIEYGGNEDPSTAKIESDVNSNHHSDQDAPGNTSQRAPTGTAADTVDNVVFSATGHPDQPVAVEGIDQLLPSKEIVKEDKILPPVDIGSGTKIICLLAIFSGIASSLACIVCATVFYKAARDEWCLDEDKGTYLCSGFIVYRITTVTKSEALAFPHEARGAHVEAISFIVNLVLTQCLEGLAYIHSTSLRWALLREDRLKFNTNIRLFTSSKLSQPNSWYMNTISVALLILCYSATSLLFIPYFSSDNTVILYFGMFINLVALWTLGVALFGQTLLAIWCYYNNLRNIPSWSSNPLNTTVVMLRCQLVDGKRGRCMLSVQNSESLEASPRLPSTYQPSQWNIAPSVRRIVIFSWFLVGLALAWFLVIVLVTRANMTGQVNFLADAGHHGNSSLYEKWHFSFSWNPVVNPTIQAIQDFHNAIYFGLSPSNNGFGDSEIRLPFGAAFVVSLLFVCAIQGLQTLGLHCAELVVNLSRDEDMWRDLNSEGQFPLSRHALITPAFLSALKSWKYNILFIFKAALHWLLGQSILPSFDSSWKRGVYFIMNYSRLLVYCICTISFASFITLLAIKMPKGSQPATYGHIQTIANVIDDWTLDENGRFWWGDKGESTEVRHAGMSYRKGVLGPIRMDALYAG